jgi:hypothetical protein
MKRKRNHHEEANNNNDSKKIRAEISHQDEEVETFAKEEFVLTREIADNAVLKDIAGNKWRIGK